jgi:tRNA (cytidine/uridine-2'-O-)-methyltransferase
MTWNVNSKKLRTAKKLRRRGRNTARGWLAQAVKTYLRALESTEPETSRDSLATEIETFVSQVLHSCHASPRCTLPVSALLDETTEWVVKELGLPLQVKVDQAESAALLLKTPSKESESAGRFKGLTPLSQLSDSSPTFKCPPLHRDTEGYLTAESVSALRNFHPEIVLFSPQIPPNTGTIARLCAAFSCRLHLIEPIGFDVNEKSFRRAGLDYWPFVELYVHPSWDEFCARRPGRRMILIETGGQNSPSDFVFQPGDLLVFGAETFGLPQNILTACLESQRGHLLTIPMYDRGVRSLNLSNSVSIATHCAVSYLHTRLCRDV